MGSSCSSRQSDGDESEGQAELINENRSTDSLSGIITDKGRDRDRHRIEAEFSSIGDDGTTAETPLSSAKSPDIPNSSKSKPPPAVSKEDLLPDISIFSSEVRNKLIGRFHDEESSGASSGGSRKGVCILVLGDTGSGKIRDNVSELLRHSLNSSIWAAGRSFLLLNPPIEVDPFQSGRNNADIVQDFISEHHILKNIFVLILESKDAPSRPPDLLSKAKFDSISASADNGGKTLLSSWYQEDHIYQNTYRRRSPQSVYDKSMKSFEYSIESYCEEWTAIVELIKGQDVKLKNIVEELNEILETNSEKIHRIRVIHSENSSEVKVEESGDQDEGMHGSTKVTCDLNVNSEGRQSLNHELSKQIQNIVHQKLKVNKDTERGVYNDGVKDDLLTEISQHHERSIELANSTPAREEYLTKVEKYLKGCDRLPLMLSGGIGSGKSSLIAHVANNIEEYIPDAVCITRFTGISCLSSTLDGLIYSITQHCYILLGTLNTPQSADQTTDMLQLFKNATPERPLVLLLDSIDEVCHESHEWQRNWLMEELPENVKIVVTLDIGNLELECSLSNPSAEDRLVIKIDAASQKERESILSSFVPESDEGWSNEFRESFSDNSSSSISPIQIMIWYRSLLLSLNSTNKLPLKSTLEEEISAFFDILEKVFSKEIISLVFGCISLSSSGLLKREIHNLTTRASLGVKNYDSAWLSLLYCLSPLLRNAYFNEVTSVSWRNHWIRRFVRKRYLSKQNREKYSQELKNIMGIEDYHMTVESSSDFNNIGGDMSLKELRCLEELSNLQPNRDCQMRLFFSPVWIFRRIVTSGPFSLLRDIYIAIKSDMTFHKFTTIFNQMRTEKDFDFNPQKIYNSQVLSDHSSSLETHPGILDLVILHQVLQITCFSLCYDPRQLFSQIYIRLNGRIPHSHCHGITDLVSYCRKTIIPSFMPLPSSFIMHDGKNAEESLSSNENAPAVYFNSVFRIPNNPHFVVTIATALGEVTVWDVWNNRKVRTLTGLNQPRHLEMIDDYKCLLLCGRELRIYNLDEGTYIMRLREVMNQKMPFFGLQNSDHVVALSRSRMYVNMMNLTEGNCVATFKVGEDRFLNSLLVSENGKTCVCGDDSQKPSALLVWNLELRKLMYDLRIPHHEFNTKFAAITKSGHYVCCVCREVDEPAPNFIVVYDLQSGTLFKRWKPGVNTISISISTAANCVVVGLQNSSLMAYDLITGNPLWSSRGHSHPVDRFRLDPNGLKLLSYDSKGRDKALRAWDIRTGASLSVLTMDTRISCCEICHDGKTAILGLQGRKELFSYVLCEKEGSFEKTVNEIEKCEKPKYGNEKYNGFIFSPGPAQTS